MQKYLPASLKLFLLLAIFPFHSSAQKIFNASIDSLETIAKSNRMDTGRVVAMNWLSIYYRNKSSFDKALDYANKAHALSTQINFKKGTGFALNNAGIAWKKMGDYTKAMENFEKAFLIYSTLKTPSGEIVDKKGLSATLVNISNVHVHWGNYPLSLDNLFRALKLSEEIKDTVALVGLYNNVGITYDHLKDYGKALEYHSKGLRLRELTNDKAGMSVSLHNIGNCYYHMKEMEKAEDYYLRAYELRKISEDISGEIASLNNLASVKSSLGEKAAKNNEKEKAKKIYEEGIVQSQQALELSLKINDRQGQANSYMNLAGLSVGLGKKAEAEKYSLNALKICLESGWKEKVSELYATLADQLSQKDPARALNYYKQHIAYRDSVTNEENTKNVVRAEMKFDFDKKQEAQRLEQKRKDELSQKELHQQKIITFSSIGGGILVLILLGVAYRGYRTKKKANHEITGQKKIIEEKQKEIVDSITYARQLQSAILATPSEIQKFFPESFLLYKPKDIVAGDFYFFEVHNGHIFFAAADCTGHGVPGALVSIVCSNALGRAIKEFNLTEPGAILDKTTELVVETFKKSGREVKDGMDISFLTLENFAAKDASAKQILWSGANNPIWLCANGNIQEIKGDKQPVGWYEARKPFKTHALTAEKDSLLYLFTDGYADQFGGPKGKKFKYKQLKELLASVSGEKMETQSSLIEKRFVEWSGNLEQVDDVCVIGIKL
jgi:serine phosphatase RsbU (regulator of sigma subunit)